MLFFKKKKRKRNRPDESKIIHWIVIGVVILSFLSNFGKNPEESKDTPINGIESNLNSFKQKFIPTNTVFFHTSNIKEGDGTPAVCGQEVRIAYEAFKNKNQRIDDSATKEKPLMFRLGEGNIMPAIERGVLGMKVGGKRTVLSPFDLSYGIKAYAKDGVTAEDVIQFDIELLSASPDIDELIKAPLRIATTKSGNGASAECGQTISVQLTMWNTEGKSIYTNAEPLSVKLGNGDTFIGLEQGLLGIQRGEKRTLIIPPILQKTLRGNTPTLDIPLPDNQTVIIDVETIGTSPTKDVP
jgi:peptidylprolyl isomerase